ncbi:transporter substrate-binding domain-containing protein [Vibrio sp. S4M6]|uniref:substrate-binding periplasmic protein n=1 Tax=Vibrio sinus TaxID=2946865 RepID=UPI00202A33B2|nr:transporter substrate-binding domain-containing protein [Vibrio sinus]MCL9781983.1 transporter substrate-binding domain-containing protein [Vibrio sinus]
MNNTARYLVFSKAWLIVSVFLMLTFSSFVNADHAVEPVSPSIINVCDDMSEWPPYTYWERVNGKVNKNKLTGAMIDLLDEISVLTGFKFHVEMRPWKRCLLEVDKFSTSKRFEMFINGTFNSDRAEKYFLTAPIYFNRPGVWYSKKRFPDGFTIKTFEQLKNYKLCGVQGYNYERYKILDPNQIDTGATTVDNALRKVEVGRCDLLLESAAIPYGFQAIGQNFIPEGVAYTPITESPETGFHVFIAKSSPRAYELLAKINQAIVILNSEGVIDDIMKSYLPTCGRHC